MINNWIACQAVIISDSFVYLTVGMVAQRLVGFIDHHTLDLLGRARLSRQIVHHDLRCEKEDTLGPPHLLSLLCCCAACGSEDELLLFNAKRRRMSVAAFAS